jgi:hypothetical protein
LPSGPPQELASQYSRTRLLWAIAQWSKTPWFVSIRIGFGDPGPRKHNGFPHLIEPYHMELRRWLRLILMQWAEVFGHPTFVIPQNNIGTKQRRPGRIRCLRKSLSFVVRE